MTLTEAERAQCNAAVVRRAVDAIWNRGDLPLADLLFAPTYVNHGGLIPDLVSGPEAIKIGVVLFRTAFPDLHITIDDLVTEGDMVELGWTAHASSGTHSPYPVSGRREEKLSGTTCSHLCNGLVLESWTTWDREKVPAGLTNRIETGWEPDADGYPVPSDDGQDSRRRDG